MDDCNTMGCSSNAVDRSCLFQRIPVSVLPQAARSRAGFGALRVAQSALDIPMANHYRRLPMIGLNPRSYRLTPPGEDI